MRHHQFIQSPSECIDGEVLVQVNGPPKKIEAPSNSMELPSLSSKLRDLARNLFLLLEYLHPWLSSSPLPPSIELMSGLLEAEPGDDLDKRRRGMGLSMKSLATRGGDNMSPLSISLPV